MWWGWAGLAMGALFAAGCGTTTQRDAPGRHDASYLPLEVSAVWRYAITADDGRRGDGALRVDGIDYGESAAGATEYRIREDLLDATIWTWDVREAGRVVLAQEEIDDRSGAVLDEETYDPPITVIDERAERLAAGAAWPEAFFDTTPNLKGHPKTKRSEVKWRVESLADTVTVPAGTFTCLCIHRAQKHHTAIVSWYAQGVGLVKQTGAGPLGDQTLALVQARLP
jgi:hypothetical protein